MHGVNGSGGWASVSNVDAPERGRAGDAQARRGRGPLGRAGADLGTAEQRRYLTGDVPRVGHANFDAAHHHAQIERCTSGGEARMAEIELNAPRGDAELSSFPLLRLDTELSTRE